MDEERFILEPIDDLGVPKRYALGCSTHVIERGSSDQDPKLPFKRVGYPGSQCGRVDSTGTNREGARIRTKRDDECIIYSAYKVPMSAGPLPNADHDPIIGMPRKMIRCVDVGVDARPPCFRVQIPRLLLVYNRIHDPDPLNNC
jgi:hypothetical protein